MNLNPYEPPQVITVNRTAQSRPSVRRWMIFAGFFLANLAVAWFFDEAYLTMFKSVSEPLTDYLLSGPGTPRFEEALITQAYAGYTTYLLSFVLIPAVAYLAYRLVIFAWRAVVAD